MNNREIINQLKSAQKLEAFGQPQEAWLLSQKETLMSQISPIEKTEDKSIIVGLSYYWSFFNEAFRYHILKPVVALGLILVLGSGLSIASTVADASLPGDAFYSMKTATEKMQLALTVSASKKTEMQMNFVSRRVSEIQEVLVKNDDNKSKVKNLTEAVKQISSGVKSISDNLNRINIASSSAKELIDLAKDIDTKTLAVGQELAKAKVSLSPEVKSELGKDMDLAIISTDQAGANALNMIVKSYSSGSSNNVSTEDVTNRVSERIKVAEENIKNIQNQVALSDDTNVTTTTQVFRLDGTMTLSSASSTQAQKFIEEAKGLLDQKDFGLAIEKIQESKNLMTAVLNNVESQVSVTGEFKGSDETNTTTGTTTNTTNSDTNSSTATSTK